MDNRTYNSRTDGQTIGHTRAVSTFTVGYSSPVFEKHTLKYNTV